MPVQQNVSEHIEAILQTLPDKPGVYIMRDADGEVIYVGKAVSLKNRVRQYFRSHKNHSAKVIAMVEKICDIHYIVVTSEMEALILECNLIKKYRPHYNILLKDDKHYPYMRIDLRVPYPRLEVVRKVQNDGAKYFGPFLAAGSITEVLDAVAQNFPLRTCKKDILKSQQRRERPCLNYQIGRCAAPCAGKISQAEYNEILEQVMAFLQGRYDDLVHELRARMEKASASLEFEQAALWRDRMQAVERVIQRQKAAVASLAERDAFALYRKGDEGVIQAFGMRQGKLIQSQHFFLDDIGQESDESVFASFLKQYYNGQAHVPREILVPVPLLEHDLLEQWLSGLRSSRVELHMPQRGEKKQLIDMAYQNAREVLEKRDARFERERSRTIGAMEELADAIGLPEVPVRMECYDISHTQGVDNVASMVVFENGQPARKEYRRFKIKTVEGADDFASMREVLTRRLMRAMDPDEQSQRRFGRLPELFVIDGGRGQLNAALHVMHDLGFDIPTIGLAKQIEEIYLPGVDETVVLDRKAPALHVLQRIRDEAHRFAITYHRSLRAARDLQSALDAVPGVGKVRKKAILTHFKTMEQIQSATVEELCAIDGVDRRTAQSVYAHLHAKQTQH